MIKEPLAVVETEATIRFWQTQTSSQLKAEDARQIVENTIGYFTTLEVWARTAGIRQGVQRGGGINLGLLKQIEPAIPSDLVSVPEASALTGISERTIWRMIRDGELHAWGPPRCYRISLSELLRPVR